ncbi:hypothetical protein GCM10022414_24330 [Zhongshania borealis]|uniref:Uracil-DNA glycosylase-like domain-containing protein n=1 Tax=Zhongshania borealis TaxID=889488 RepID=A0ABP7WWD6_9GAMM
MNEALRLDYLQAMGVDTYVPRFVLDGAAPSPIFDFEDFTEDALSEDDSAAAVAIDADAEYQQMAEADERKEQVPVSESPRPGSRIASALQELGFETAKPESLSAVAANGEGADAASPEFTVELVATGIGLVMIVDTTAGAPSPAEKRLMANIAMAVSRYHKLPKVPQFATSGFQWPVMKTPGITLGKDAAKEALQANIMAQAERQQAHCAILFGSTLQPYIDAATLQTAGIQLLYAAEPAAMLADGNLKAPLWQNLRKVLFSV